MEVVTIEKFIKSSSLEYNMPIVSKSLVELLQEIEGSKCIFQETISPDSNPDLFVDLATTDGGSTRIPDCQYRDKLMQIITPFYKPHRFKWVTPPDYEPCLLEAVTNAFERGKPPVTFQIFTGKKGHVLRIEDSGEGFDYQSKIAEMKSGSEEFYQRSGGGFKTFERKPYQVSYEIKGNVFNLQILNGQ